jgi:beta-lactamase superfamily II metal-dependent hydrolase
MAHRFAGLGEAGEKVFLYEDDLETKYRQVLWGDFLQLEDAQPGDDSEFLRVRWAPNTPGARTLFVKAAETVETRPLEIVFVDVGQGDGAVLITPERDENERILVIDAGEGDNMARFLNTRFRAYRGFDFHAAVITHPDTDHYRGFREIFEDHDIGFEAVYHDGLLERPVSGDWEKVGGFHDDATPGSDLQYVGDLVLDRADVEAHCGTSVDIGRFVYPNVMRAALENPKIDRFEMLSTAHGQIEDGRSYLPGFGPSDGRGYTIEVLNPIAELDAAGEPRLRRISSDYAKFKNGHSVILKLAFGDFGILFGGDLNVPAEQRILTHYAGIGDFPDEGSAASGAMIAAAAQSFRSDVMKVCHHGSEKVTDEFLRAVNPACFVISSGDEEGHVHPRPDLLGRLGRLGRGEAPVLLSTELQRSTREVEDRDEVDKLLKAIDGLDDDSSEEDRADVRERIRDLARTNVEVYGAIYLKTDGERLITAFRIEEDSLTDRWFYFEYVRSETGELELVEH